MQKYAAKIVFLFTFILILGLPSVVHAFQDSNSGCRILLCLANPKGPMSVPECRPDIRDFYRAIAKGKPYPNCENEAGEKYDSYFSLAHDNYQVCPKGTTDSRAKPTLLGGYVTDVNVRDANYVNGWIDPNLYSGEFLSSGFLNTRRGRAESTAEQLAGIHFNNPSVNEEAYFNNKVSPPTALACVGKSVGTKQVCLPAGSYCGLGGNKYTTVYVFDKVVYRKYNPNSFVANIFIKDKAAGQASLWQRVRLFGIGDNNEVDATIETDAP